MSVQAQALSSLSPLMGPVKIYLTSILWVHDCCFLILAHGNMETHDGMLVAMKWSHHGECLRKVKEIFSQSQVGVRILCYEYQESTTYKPNCSCIVGPELTVNYLLWYTDWCVVWIHMILYFRPASVWNCHTLQDYLSESHLVQKDKTFQEIRWKRAAPTAKKAKSAYYAASSARKA